MPFDPDKFLAENNSDFDPDAFLGIKSQKITQAQDPNQPSEFESGLRGAVQGFSFGWSDEITGRLESVFSEKTYEQARDEARAANKAAEKANPSSYMAGDIAGGVASSLIPVVGVAGKIGGVIKGAVGLSKAAKVVKTSGSLAKIAKGAATGVAAGAAEASGRTDADWGTDKFLEDTKDGAIVGGIIGGGLPAVVETAKGVAKKGKNVGDFVENWYQERKIKKPAPDDPDSAKALFEKKQLAPAELKKNQEKYAYDALVDESDLAIKGKLGGPQKAAAAANIAAMEKQVKKYSDVYEDRLDTYSRMKTPDQQSAWKELLPDKLMTPENFAFATSAFISSYVFDIDPLLSSGVGGTVALAASKSSVGKKIIKHALNALLEQPAAQKEVKRLAKAGISVANAKALLKKMVKDSLKSGEFYQKSLVATGAALQESKD